MGEAGQLALLAAEIIVAALVAAEGIKSLDVAEDYYDLYKEQRDFYYSTFQNGVEGPLAAEVFAIPAYTKNYVQRIADLYDTSYGILSGAAVSAPIWLERRRAMYADTAFTDIDQEIQSDTQRIVSDWTNYFFRYEEHVADTEQDIRWRKRITMHNVGIKQGTAIAGALDQSLGAFQEQLNGLGDQLATYGNGIARYAGYRKGQSDTSDDFQSAAPRIQLPDNRVQIGVPA